MHISILVNKKVLLKTHLEIQTKLSSKYTKYVSVEIKSSKSKKIPSQYFLSQKSIFLSIYLNGLESVWMSMWLSRCRLDVD